MVPYSCSKKRIQERKQKLIIFINKILKCNINTLVLTNIWMFQSHDKVRKTCTVNSTDLYLGSFEVLKECCEKLLGSCVKSEKGMWQIFSTNHLLDHHPDLQTKISTIAWPLCCITKDFIWALVHTFMHSNLAKLTDTVEKLQDWYIFIR